MLEKLNELTEGHGALKRGHGLISGVIALSLAILCFLGVLAFHFPEYLTTPQLRKSYNVDLIRNIMLVALAIAGGISLVNVILNRARWLAAFAFAFGLVALNREIRRARRQCAERIREAVQVSVYVERLASHTSTSE